MVCWHIASEASRKYSMLAHFPTFPVTFTTKEFLAGSPMFMTTLKPLRNSCYGFIGYDSLGGTIVSKARDFCTDLTFSVS